MCAVCSIGYSRGLGKADCANFCELYSRTFSSNAGGSISSAAVTLQESCLHNVERRKARENDLPACVDTCGFKDLY